MKKILIVQSYVPNYRRVFFDHLAEELRRDSIELTIAAGAPSGDQAARGDDANFERTTTLRNRAISVGGRTITLGSSYPLWRKVDALILGHLGSSIETNLAVAASKVSRLKVGVWGHVRSYVAPAHPVDRAVETVQLRLADHVFAYTSGGRAEAINRNVDPSKVTAVMNSVDTTELENHRKLLFKQNTVPELFGKRPTYLFIGGLDSSKRIDFLARSLDIVWEINPKIQVLVAGAGVEAYLLEKARLRGQVQMLGYANAEKKASLLHYSRGVLMPGRIGLVAVDALVMRTPILTTNWKFHAPEAEYLVEGISRLSAGDSVQEYAQAILSHEREPIASVIRDDEWSYPSLTDMVSNFRIGVNSLLE